MEVEEVRLSIYKAARTIKRKQSTTLYNAVRSIYEDSIFVGEISQLWPDLPLLANLRCGLWYSPKFLSTCYFKSTDGHNNNWSFNTSRLNLHVALLAGQKGGCIIVDSTRKGKRFPDSMSKTIPIWTCVLNRAINNYRNMMHENALMKDIELSTLNINAKKMEHASLKWDWSLHLPLWVSKTEKASIEDRLEEWTRQLEASGADIASLEASLKKPLRPLWISQKSIIWLNEVPDHDSWDFTPVILVSASSSTGVSQRRTSSEFSWTYIPGAGDDEESWARGLTPNLFWDHAYDLINSGPHLCNQKFAEVVEKERVYHAQRGHNAPLVSVKPQKPLGSSDQSSSEELSLQLELLNLKPNGNSRTEYCVLSWLGSTNIAVGTTQLASAAAPEVACILNCDKELLMINPYAYLHLPIVSSKFNRFSLLSNLPSAVNFARSNLARGKTLLVCCHDGEDISICVSLAILISLFDDQGAFDNGRSFEEAEFTKWDMRR
ncbi:hypothetical protein Nepgr_005180 [Nepenthes gracilis]|uniref:Initiator tRNA phosphoribosyl transferase family protein n=1 Tax=Nepenthes gracilis TaxID=150966 RepID=A0AAD3S2V7_NEPGR|nr:hypothetical protein Nepgr_005180 [Nepenthes gracilis]